MHFFSFFDMLPSAPATTGMTLMLLMFHVLLISLLSSWCLSVFSFFFQSYLSRFSNINYGTTSLILIHCNNIGFSCLDLCVVLDHNIPQSLHFLIFNNTWGHVHTIFHLFSGCISHTLSNERFLQHYCALFYTPFVPTFHICSQ